MKTTNFENSKRLAELGFDAKTKSWWIESSLKEPTHQLRTYNTFVDYVGNNFRAYGLETIIDALPIYLQFHKEEIGETTKWFLSIQVILGNFQFSYTNWKGVSHFDFYSIKNTNESLADCAARLLIKLIEEKIIDPSCKL